MKKIFLLAGICLSIMLTGCEDFLDVDNLTKKDTSNFPETKEDAEAQLISIYANLSEAVGVKEKSYFFVSCIASDDAFGGGGNNDRIFQAYDFLMSAGENMFEPFWEVRYKGIFRANSLIETIDNAKISESLKNMYVGEAYFLRALFYYEMASLFGTVPLVIQTEPLNLPKATPEELFGQIASDLKNAIELMPSQRYTSVPSGRATKWAAQALMARVYLFYTGFYGKDSIALPDGGTVTKANVTEWLNDCIDNSGYDLVNDFRRLWAYSNSKTVSSLDDDNEIKKNGLIWAEDFGAPSPETVFSIKFSNQSKNEGGNVLALGFSNQMCLFMGLRGNQDKASVFPFGQGWGAAPANPRLYTDWRLQEPNDMRLAASIINIPVEMPGYQKGADNNVQETDYWQKKIIPVRSDTIDAEGNRSFFDSFCMQMFNTKGDYQTANIQDLILIRFADVLLMHSELTETNTGLNRVRQRAGLEPKGYSLEAIQRERRFELAFEGIRWNDIRRWGIAAQELDKQLDQPIYNFAVEDRSQAYGGGYSARYNATKGFFPIPESQVRLSEGVLKQNEGWGADSNFPGWTK